VTLTPDHTGPSAGGESTAAGEGTDVLSRPLRLVLLGGPGVGKGTQAELLMDRLGMYHLSTGDMFRAIGAKPPETLTPVMQQAIELISGGRLVPDETVIELVRHHLEEQDMGRGILFDGFPRTVPQAEALDRMLEALGAPLDAVLDYELEEEKLIERLSGRRTCLQCGASFHVLNLPPKNEGICDHCGSPLIQRTDDRPATVLVRLQTYHRKTCPLIDFYRGSGRLIPVTADGAPTTIAQRSIEALRRHLGG
jgi:adenylate kinase